MITAVRTCASPGAGGASPNRCSACTSARFAPEDRSQPGHWEGDVIVGPQHRSAIGTLVERQSRLVKLIHLPRPDSLSCARAAARAGWVAGGAASVDHLGSGQRDGPPPGDHRGDRGQGVFLRRGQPMATRHEREHLLVQGESVPEPLRRERFWLGRWVTRRTRAERPSVDLSTAAHRARALTGSDLIEAC